MPAARTRNPGFFEEPGFLFYATTFVVTTIWGGFSIHFFTAHCSAERMTASLYFSGNSGDRWISSSIFATLCVVGIDDHFVHR
ncbi:MAG: hypothetical protein ACM30E_04840 [Nitrososphaerales archaeon]